MLPNKRLRRTASALLLVQGKAFTGESYGNFCSYLEGLLKQSGHEFENGSQWVTVLDETSFRFVNGHRGVSSSFFENPSEMFSVFDAEPHCKWLTLDLHSLQMLNVPEFLSNRISSSA